MFGKINRKLKSGEIKESLKYQCKNCQTLVQKERRKKQQEENPELFHQRWNDSYQKRKERERELEKIRLSKPENREKRNEYVRNYKAKKRIEDPTFKIFENHRKRIWKCLNKKSNSSKELLGCNIDFYYKWISFTMTVDENMNWDNYG